MSARDSTFRASIGSLIHLSIDQEKYQHDWPALVLFRLRGGLYQASLLAFSKDRKTSRRTSRPTATAPIMPSARMSRSRARRP
jgi:hypothetical protein